ncbi:MAG: hypothetical protein JWO56_3010 [Acidobacteria bacterium]|nr:hypothetical protein [Acidobacteriota bacterium]
MKKVFLLFAASITAMSCTSEQIELPASLASSSEVVPVKRAFLLQGSNSMTIGAYSITGFHDAKKTRVRSDSLVPPYVPDIPGVPRAREATTKQTIRFVVNDTGTPKWNVLCQSRNHEDDLASSGGNLELPGRFKGETVCAIDGLGDETSKWTLNLSQYRPGIARTSIQGELTDGTTTYELMPIYRIVGGEGTHAVNLPYPLGFSIQRGDAAVAAIDTLAQGRNTARIHFGRDLDPGQRSLIAAVSAAVLLQQEDRGGVTIGR